MTRIIIFCCLSPERALGLRMFGKILNILAIGGLVAIGAIIVAIMRAGPLPVDPCSDDVAAWRAAQEAVAGALRSPSTAKFPSRFGGDVEIRSAPGCVLYVLSWVDSQNGFGGTVRTKFIARLRGSGSGGKPVIEKIDFEG